MAVGGWIVWRWRASSPSDEVMVRDQDAAGAGQDTRFGKRYYASLSQCLGDWRAMWDHRELMRESMHSIDPAFRTRLMLAVTQVNGCRYCSFYHARVGLQEGLTQDEIDALLAGISPDMGDTIPEDQAVALFYAQHWAETHGMPEAAANERLFDTYGSALAEQIQMLLRAISMGNLMGNTLDYVLFRLHGGA